MLIFGEKLRFVIVPAGAIKTEGINIPVPRRTGYYNNRKPVVDYLQFENRFDLLKGAKRT